MNLFIDIGNSRIKWLISEQGKAPSYGGCDYEPQSIDRILETAWQENWQNQLSPGAVYVSNVVGNEAKKDLHGLCGRHWQLQPCFADVSKECLGVKNAYPDIQQLGVDRWLAMIAAWHVYKTNILIVDCGTALTIDAVKAEDDDYSTGVHQGGLIIPGVRMMNELLAGRTHGINKVKFNPDKKIPHFAASTEEGLYAGSIHAATAVIEKSYKQFQAQCAGGIECILTGGASGLILPELEIEITHNPHLVLTGLELWSQLQ